MQKFYKKCAVIYDLNGEPIFVADVLDFKDESEYQELKNKARVNFENQMNLKNKESKEFKDSINKSIYDLANAVKTYTNK